MRRAQADDRSNVYRPYDPTASLTRGPRPTAAAWGDGSGQSLGRLRVPAQPDSPGPRARQHTFALFHDGNAGHFWRGEVASLLGEAVLSVGVLIWLVDLTGSPWVALSAVLALALPWVLIGPQVAPLQRVREPGRLLAWVGRLRVVAALGVVAMHFATIYPLLYLLLFVIGASGRARQALRVAATRSCLAPGEVEQVANDIYIGAAVVAVVGPLLGATLYLALGARVILVGLGAAALFLLASNSDGFLDALPIERRAFFWADPVDVAPDDATRDGLLAAARAAITGEDEAEVEHGNGATPALSPEARELALPEWYQEPPASPVKAMADIRAGLALAGGQNVSASGLLALIALAFVGGGLSVLEVFYLGDQLNMPPLFLGALLAVEGGGLALGNLLANSPRLAQMGTRRIMLGLIGAGLALALMGLTPSALVATGAALALGVCNALVAGGAQAVLFKGFTGVERRAIGAGEGYITALAGIIGAFVFTILYAGAGHLHVGARPLFPGLPSNVLFLGVGLGLILGALILSVKPGLSERVNTLEDISMSAATRARMAAAKPGASQVGSLWDANAHDDADGDYDEGDERDAYDEDGYARGETGYTGAYATGYRGRYDDEGDDDGWDDEPPARGPRRPGRPPQRGGRW